MTNNRNTIVASQRIFKVLPWIGVVLGVLFLLFTAGGGDKKERAAESPATGPARIERLAEQKRAPAVQTVAVRQRVQQDRLTPDNPTRLVQLGPGEESAVFNGHNAKWFGNGKTSTCVEVRIDGKKKSVLECPDGPPVKFDEILGGPQRFTTLQFLAPDNVGAELMVCANFVRAERPPECAL